MRRFICILMTILCLPGLYCQNSLLEGYIREGIESNLALKQKEADYRKSLLALEQARSYFFPSLRLQARYTVADGGRIIEFPLGDLLNPVYNTLNLLTGSQSFPEVENQSFRFYRAREHETKLELTQPVFNPEIAYQYKISKSLSAAEKANMESFKRQLVSDIKSAYYAYKKTLGLEKLTSESRALLEENLRVNRKLYENQLATIDAVYRSQAELARLEQAEAEVEKQKQLAGSWFNFLLNRERGTPLVTDSLPSVFQVLTVEKAGETALSGREELEGLDWTLDASMLAVKLHKSNALPRLYAVVDYGFQGEEYRFTGDDDFVLASLVLSWDLFRGRLNRSKTRQAMAEQEKLETLREETARKIELEAEQAWYTLQAARKKLVAAGKEQTASAEAFRQIDRRYREGNASQLEWMDARNRYTTSAENVIQAEFDLAIFYADYERVTAAYSFPEPETREP